LKKPESNAVEKSAPTVPVANENMKPPPLASFQKLTNHCH
jgi:hypothetical protein